MSVQLAEMIERPQRGDRTRAPGIIAEAFGLSMEQFDAEIRSRTFSIGHSARLAARELMSWGQFNDLLSQANRRLELLQVSKEGKRVDRSHFTRMDTSAYGGHILAPSIARALRDGYSVVMNAVEGYHWPAAELARRLMSDVGESIVINTYVSWTSDRCFTTHWDDHDVFIVQTEGEKEWFVYKPTREAPLQLDVECDTFRDGLEPAWSGVLRRGDVLYLPRGWWHHAKSTGQGSIHLTCGFTNRTALDVISFLAEEACRDPALRRDLPRRGATEPQGGELVIERLRCLMSDTSAGSVLDRFWRRHFATLSTPAAHHLPYTLDIDLFASTDHRLATASPARDLCVEVYQDSIAIEAGLQRWELSRRAQALVEAVLCADSLLLSDLTTSLPGDLSREETVHLVFELLNDGFLTILPPSQL